MKRIICGLVSAAALLSFSAPFTAFAENDAADDEFVTFIVQTDGASAVELRSEFGAKVNAFGKAYIENETEDVKKKNEEIRDRLAEKLGADVSDSFIYTETDSGFTITARRGDMDKILSEDGVTNVSEDGYLYAVPDDETTGGDAVNTSAASEEYKGEGTLIAVIDSGFQLSHPYFSSVPQQAKLSQSQAEEYISELGHGKYYSAKIPYTYDYYSNSSEDKYITNGSEHGTHVAGIAAGKNGVISNGDVINGAAPEAQMALMACSKDGNSMSFSVVKKAIDDAVKLNADVINMSLGLPYADVRNSGYDTVRTSINSARTDGIVVCVSQGNSGRGFYETDPLVTHPDYSAAGMMANIPDAFSVASADTNTYYNTFVKLVTSEGTAVYGAEVNADDGVGAFVDTITSDTEYVDCGYGSEDDLDGKALTGKVALIQRGGGLSFVDKTTNAKNAGAVAVILYDNVNEEYLKVGGFVLPSLFIKKADGEAMAAMETKTVRAEGKDLYNVTNTSTAGEPSKFSSWGFSETMGLTPGITAYGGNVYSSAPGSGYQNMSGTSMASPYIAGVSACVKSYLNTEPFGELTDVNTADLIQQLLMSTAEPIRYRDSDVEYSPRQQGAGLVRPDKAVETPVVLYNGDNKTLVDLGDGIDSSFTLEFTARNYSDEDITFEDVSLDVITDGAGVTGNNDVVFYKTNALTVTDYTDDSITIPANSTKDISIAVTLKSSLLASYANVFTNGFYIDGFLRLSNTEHEVGLPFSGFRGNWCKAPIWDKTIYDEGGSELVNSEEGCFGTYLITVSEGNGVVIGAEGTYPIISPANNDGRFDNINAAFVMYRAADRVAIKLMQGGKAKLTRTISGYLSKFTPYSYAVAYNAAQTSTLRSLPDGDYTLRLTGRFNNGKSTSSQDLDYPLMITIDNTAPDIDMILSEDYSTLEVAAEDENYLRSITVRYTDNSGTAQEETLELDNTQKSCTHVFSLSDANPATINVTAMDYAYNSTTDHDLAIVAENGGISATMFKTVLNGEGTYTGMRGTVTSDGVTKVFERDLSGAVTLENGADLYIGLIVEGLYDNKANAVIELR